MNWNGIFNPENRFWRFMEKIADVFFLGILWLLFSLPIVTVGAATTAMYQFTLKQADDEEGHVLKSFWTAFCKNFLPATALWLILLAIGSFLVADLWLCLNLPLPSFARVLCLGMLICLCLLYVMTALFVFPILSRFDLPVRKILAHSFVMAVGNLYVSVTVLFIHAVFGIICYVNTNITILAPIFVALAAFVSSYFFRSVFIRYRREQTCDGDETAGEEPNE